MKKLKLVLILIVIVFSALLCNYNYKKNKVISIAEEYIINKYSFEPGYISCYYYFIEGKYEVTFFHNNLLFSVIVPSSSSVLKDRIWGDYVFSADNYIQEKFDFLMTENLISITNGHFKDFLIMYDSGINSFEISKNAKVTMDLPALEKEMDYYINIDAKKNTDLTEEAKRIYYYISVIKKQNYTPELVTIDIQDNSEDGFVIIYDLAEINSYEDILSRIK